MSSKKQSLLNKLTYLLFFVCFAFMIHFGKETFYVKNTDSTSQAYKYHFALITEEVGNEYWHLIEKGAQEEAKSQNVYLEYVGPAKSNYKEKMEIFDRMISAHVDGIIIQGNQGDEFLRLVAKARDHNIGVITIDADAPESERNVYVGTNNYYAGVLAGQTFIKETKGEQYVGVIVGTMDSSDQVERLEGFKSVIKNEDRIHLVDVKESNITEIGAIEATYSLLKQYPEITALFGTSALDGIGIVQGAEEMVARKYPYILAFGNLPQTISLIEQGKIQASVTQYPYEMGKLAVSNLVEVLSEDHVRPLQYTDTNVIRQKDIKNGEMILIEGPL